MGNNDIISLQTFKNFESVFKKNFTSLVTFAMTIVDSQEIAEDIVQEVFIKIWENKKNTTFHKTLKGYLFISVKNSCLNHLKREKRKLNKEKELTPKAFDLYDTDIIESSERNRLIFEAIEKLSTKGKIVLKLICFGNLKYKEVAEELDISVDTVKYHYTHSLKKLRELLTKEQFIFFIQFIRIN
ncbi:MAG: RNA polymerase sigma-70 factor [Marinifilum sp.]|jgi:RNA polymerase sigma-70 factor (ECF subfamily)|nr:RNA polymerase sigma-70 factor [Marinifilum sp.]